jgi:3-polyprenyl-4-hydroxybenzoate decarboxylase
MATRMEASRDLLVLPGLRGHEYVRVSAAGIRAKLAVDATVPFADRSRFRRACFADVRIGDDDIVLTPHTSTLPWLKQSADRSTDPAPVVEYSASISS